MLKIRWLGLIALWLFLIPVTVSAIRYSSYEWKERSVLRSFEELRRNPPPGFVMLSGSGSSSSPIPSTIWAALLLIVFLSLSTWIIVRIYRATRSRGAFE